MNTFKYTVFVWIPESKDFDASYGTAVKSFTANTFPDEAEEKAKEFARMLNRSGCRDVRIERAEVRREYSFVPF